MILQPGHEEGINETVGANIKSYMENKPTNSLHLSSNKNFRRLLNAYCRKTVKSNLFINFTHPYLHSLMNNKNLTK